MMFASYPFKQTSMKTLILLCSLMAFSCSGWSQGCDLTPNDGTDGPISVNVEDFKIISSEITSSGCNFVYTLDYIVNNPQNCSIWNLSGVVRCGDGGSATTFNMQSNGVYNTHSTSIFDVSCDSDCTYYINGGWGGICPSTNVSWPGMPCAVISLASMLPVELVTFKFDTDYQGKGIRLQWETASEFDNYYFEVLMSEDGRNFSPVNKVFPHTGNSDGASYNFLHADAPRGSVYYKLKQVDNSGETSFSHVIFRSAIPKVSWALFPNPTADSFQISAPNQSNVNEVLEYKMRRLTGAEVKSGTFVVGEAIDVAGMLSGIYLFEWSFEGERFARRVVVE